MRSSEHNSWSVKLGRWAGVRVRLHVFFLLFALITLYLTWAVPSARPGTSVDWVTLTSLVVLLASVIWHEVGHYLAVTRLGGVMHQSVLVPWGGLSSFTIPRDPYLELIVPLAGPVASMLLCVISIPIVMLMDGEGVIGLLNPLQPTAIDIAPEQTFGFVVLFKLTLWINWLLVIVNLIPAYPFDGGQILKALLSRVVGRHQSGVVVARFAQLASIGLVITAWFVRDAGPDGIVPVWFALVLLAIVIFFSATQEPQRRERETSEDELFGYDFSQGYTSLERSATSAEEDTASPISQWLEQRRRARHKRELEQEVEEERRVDDILARLHQGGIESLSDEDRAILHRVSARYRSRLGDSG